MAEVKKNTIDENYTLLVKAAANGANNSLSKLVNPLITEEQKNVISDAEINGENLSKIEILARARANVVKELSDPAVLKSTTSQENGLEKAMEYWDNPVLALVKNFGSQIWATMTGKSDPNEGWIEKWDRAGKEIEIKNFSRLNKIDPEKLLAELKTLPQDTDKIAAITPEQQAAKLEKAEQVRFEKAAKEAKAAEEIEIARLKRLQTAGVSGTTNVEGNSPPLNGTSRTSSPTQANGR